MKASEGFTALAIAVAGCASASQRAQTTTAAAEPLQQRPDALVAGEVMAVAYSGFREGQHPDRGDGAVNPSADEILEDLRILVAHDFRLIRLYDSGENSAMTVELIHKHRLPIKVMLGIWLNAEFSNHEGCPWLDEPIPESELAANAAKNAAELRRAIALARKFDDVIVSVNVGNEAFDEPWKGSPWDPLGAEKHWGLFHVDRTPKQLLRESPSVNRPTG